MMKVEERILAFIFFLIVSSWPTEVCIAQDGSNIRYVDRLDKTYVGDLIHIDFYRRSFHEMTVDTVFVKIGDKRIKFLEHRQDNGYNNWFDQQFLTSTEEMDGLSMRVTKSKVNKVTSDSIFVTNYIDYYDDKKNLVKSQLSDDQYPTKIIAEFLVSEKSHKQMRNKE